MSYKAMTEMIDLAEDLLPLHKNDLESHQMRFDGYASYMCKTGVITTKEMGLAKVAIRSMILNYNKKGGDLMSYMTKLGVLTYINESKKQSQDKLSKASQAWFEGFAAGMYEAEVIDDDEYEEILDYLVSLKKRETNHGD